MIEIVTGGSRLSISICGWDEIDAMNVIAARGVEARRRAGSAATHNNPYALLAPTGKLSPWSAAPSIFLNYR